MTTEEKNKLDSHFDIWTADARKFLDEELNAEKNEHGAYIYQSKSGNHSLLLDMVLSNYKDWLIEKRIIKDSN